MLHEVLILGPLGYEPNTLPLCHGAVKMLVIYQEWTCIWTCMTIKVMERLIAMTGKSLLHEVSILGHLGYEPNTLPLRHGAVKMLVIYQERTCIWTCMTIKVMERLEHS